MDEIHSIESSSIAIGIESHPPVLSGAPCIVVLIPTYGHPVLLGEAIESVLAQQINYAIGIVIVSDGCCLAETDLVAASYSIAHRNVVYLKKVNGGPSSARNYGIDFLLQNWPTVEAVYFLDADNRLAPTALADSYAALSTSPGVGWIYPNIDSFGVVWAANYEVPYSPLLHIVYDNMCDTGSLVSRELLMSGVRFDEDARSGYEDWDFWLQGLEKGFIGKPLCFGFSYRQRPESRFREMNRQRTAAIDHLRRRHWNIAAPRNLLRWEHETNPRFVFISSLGGKNSAFTDPVMRQNELSSVQIESQFFASRHQPDETLLWPFFVFGDGSVLDALNKLGLIHSIFFLLERESASASFVALTLEYRADEMSVTIGKPTHKASLHRKAMLWMCRAQRVVEVVDSDEASWFGSLSGSSPEPDIIQVHVAAPLTGLSNRDEQATQALMSLLWHLRGCALNGVPRQRWRWRPQHFPSRENYYDLVCKYVGVTNLMPRLHGDSLDIGVVVPIASFGGAEKVSYAMGRYLRSLGAKVHLFVVGAPLIKIIDEYSTSFDTINFLADPEFPVWGGPVTVMGQQCFLPGSTDLKTNDLTGFLVNLDLIVNCHSAPLNSIMGALRSHYKAKTATYLHVFDSTVAKRPVGHPFLAVAFEHAYDLILTCSRQLADQVHSLGVPAEKVMPIQNAAGFTISWSTQQIQLSRRSQPREKRNLRVLYIGRLDPQKGVERLIGAVQGFSARKMAVDVRVIGDHLFGSNSIFKTALKALGVSLEPAVYSNDALAAAYSWADVLILPSRWEGAPLVIPECQQFGCIPVCTRVGAVEELVSNEVDGLTVEDGDDYSTGLALVDAVEGLLNDDEMRCRLAIAGINRSKLNQWHANFAPLGQWIASTFRTKSA